MISYTIYKQCSLVLSLLTINLIASAQNHSSSPADNSSTCTIVSNVNASLDAAKQQFEQTCPGLTRDDCDPVSNNRWMCSTDNISASTPVKPVYPGNAPEPEPAAPVPKEPDQPPIESDPVDPDTSDPTSAEIKEHIYGKNAGPFKNPLKGWNSGWNGGNDHPESSVGFQYIPWKDFEPSDGRFDYGAVENIIDREGSKNRHLILRLYCDWHGNDRASDCPSWMYNEAGVARLRGSNGRYITDFNDDTYLAQARDAIKALAHRYDDDPRMFAFQMGVIGYWGEWHSWGSSFNGISYDITDKSKRDILNAYATHFDNAKIMARYPWREPAQSADNLGFHNDYFVANNGHSDQFDTAVSSGGQWTKNPIGGEVPPRGGSEANNEKAALFNGDVGRMMIETGHYSTMKAGAYRVTENDRYHAGYMRLHKMMGYNYQIDVARFAESAKRSDQLSAEVIGTNIGVAPMYFDWDVQFALLDGNSRPVVVENAATDLRSILPGAMFDFSSDIDLGSVDEGRYKLAVRIIQPGADKQKDTTWKLDARNTYIEFSNDLTVVNGKWINNRLVGGWSILGDVTVR